MILEHNPILDEATGAILRRSKNLGGINKWLINEGYARFSSKASGLRPTWVAIDQLANGEGLLQIGGEHIPGREIGGPAARFITVFASFSVLVDWVDKKRALRGIGRPFVNGNRPPHGHPARFRDLSAVQIDALLAAFPGRREWEISGSLDWLAPESDVDPAYLRVMIDEALTRTGL